jgi:hypothetical protein
MSETRNGSPTFYKLLEEMAVLHDKKSHDYASNSNPSGNYHFAGKLALLFAHSEQDAGYVGRLGEKIYRLANLEGSGKTPQNESIQDTEIDICVITALWMADRMDRRRNNPKIMTSPDRAMSKIIELEILLGPQERVDLINYLQEIVKKDSMTRSDTVPK